MPERAALITVLILDRPMCLECIASRADMSISSVRGYLERIGKMVTVQQVPTERCQACGNVGYAVAIGREAP
jgi:hypothetical protein